MYSYNRDLPKTQVVNQTLEIDWKLYKKLLKYRSHSRSETQLKLLKFIAGWIGENIDNAVVKLDDYGNMYVTKGTSDIYPCVVGHLDINQDKCKDFSIIQTPDYIFGLDNKTGMQCGLGHDDKAGVYFGLLMLQKLEYVKCFFPLDEEVGCIGSGKADMKFFKDCSMLVQLDRNSFDNDISYFTNGCTVVSQEFRDFVDTTRVLKEYNYDWAHCVYTDIGQLVKNGAGCVGMNISSGYFNEHMEYEVLSVNHYINAVNFAHDLIVAAGLLGRWHHVPYIAPPKQSYVSKPLPAPVKKNEDAWEKWDARDYDPWEGEWDTKSKVKMQPLSFREALLTKGEYYHHSDHWDFQTTDEDTVIEAIETGVCPVCNSPVMTLEEGEQVCGACESVYYIPMGKNYMECINEYDQTFGSGK
jgi:tripeptide aminopeptidase